MPPMPESAIVNGATLTLTYGEDLQATTWTSTPGSSPVYLAVLSEPGERRNIETAPGTMAQASGRTVTVTLDRRAEYNQEVTLSYFPDNAEALSRVRDLGGNEAEGFAGLEVRNDTPQGPHVEGAAFAEAAKTYAIGDTIEVDVTFSESVRVRAAPTIGLAIGSATRKAVWKADQAPGTVHRFAYTVAQGDLDTDGITIRRNTLALGGGTIATVAKSGTVDLRHDSLPRHRDRTVDGVRPAVKAGAEGADARGPELVLTWTEELDPASVPAGSGGFTIKIGGTVEPAVRSVAIDGATVRLALVRGIRAGTTGVTVDYTPQSATPIKDRAGNAAVAFTGRAVTARSADNNEATGTVTVSGSATVGQRLTATVSDIADPDGPPSTAYTVTWLRIDGSSETTIATSTLATGVASNSYTLAALDAGKRIKVKVAFEDYLGNAEELESAAFPGFGRIMWSAESACAMPSLEGRELVWTGQVGVGTNTVGGVDFSHGFGPDNTGSTLSDKTFSFGGTGYTIDFLAVGAPGSGPRPGALEFSVTAHLPTASTSGLQLHVCGDTFHFGDGPDSGNNPDTSYVGNLHTYRWSSSGLDWSGHATRRMYLSKGDTRAPVLTDIVVDGATLTMIYDEKLNRTDPVREGGGTPPYTVAVAGNSPFTLSGKCAALDHPFPTLGALASSSSPPRQQSFMRKATSPPASASRTVPSSQEIRLRNIPVKSRGDPTS